MCLLSRTYTKLKVKDAASTDHILCCVGCWCVCVCVCNHVAEGGSQGEFPSRASSTIMVQHNGLELGMSCLRGLTLTES